MKNSEQRGPRGSRQTGRAAGVLLAVLLGGCEPGFPFHAPKLLHLSDNPIDSAIESRYLGLRQTEEFETALRDDLDAYLQGTHDLELAVIKMEEVGASCLQDGSDGEATCSYTQWATWERYIFPFGWCEYPRDVYSFEISLKEQEGGISVNSVEATTSEEEKEGRSDTHRCRAERPEN